MRATDSFDICPAPARANLERLAGFLRAVNARELAKDAEVAVAFGVEVKVCSLAALRKMKRAAGRRKDLDDLDDLDKARGPEDVD